MKFIKLESRGGNYLVVAENVAWLRTAENGQTSVGIIGGQPLLVVGSVEEVAAKILAGSAPEEEAPAAQNSAAPAGLPAATTAPAPAPAAATPEPAHEVMPCAPEPEAPAHKPVRLAPVPKPAEAPKAANPKPAIRQGTTLSERIAAASAPRVKSGTQRFMGSLE